jgi:hypothetical protein
MIEDTSTVTDETSASVIKSILTGEPKKIEKPKEEEKPQLINANVT